MVAKNRIGQQVGDRNHPVRRLLAKHPTARRRVIDSRTRLAAQHTVEFGAVFPEIVEPAGHPGRSTQTDESPPIPGTMLHRSEVVFEALPVRSVAFRS